MTVLSVKCPVCKAEPGQECIRPLLRKTDKRSHHNRWKLYWSQKP